MISLIRLKNFKSIRDVGDLHLKPINILIGSNGAGKSNLIAFFQLLRNIYEQNLRGYVAENGGVNNLLHFGRKTSNFIEGQVFFGNQAYNSSFYHFQLNPNQANGFYFEKDIGAVRANLPNEDHLPSIWSPESYTKGHEESQMNALFREEFKADFQNFKVYHFEDTSANSPLKQARKVSDNRTLSENGGNLPSLLYLLQEKYPANFKLIEATIRSIAPFFQRFDLAPDRLNSEYIQLEWKEQGSDMYFNAHNLSDGTLRMMCLVTLLLQPDLPKTIIIDEPELGLHPSAINKLAGLMRSASTKSQLIVSTQSVNLIDNFNPEDIIVVDRKDRQSVFTRLKEEELKEWLETYSLGELWDKNIIGGRP
ncbi:MAG: AAA family ATPase [Bacteroidota bacterium]